MNLDYKYIPYVNFKFDKLNTLKMSANINFSNQFFVNIISDVEMLRTRGHQMGHQDFQHTRQSIMNNIDLMVMQNEHDAFINRISVNGERRLNLLEPRVVSPIGSPRSPVAPPPPPRIEASGGGWVQIRHRDEPTWAEEWRQLKRLNKRSCIGRSRFEAQCKDDCAICLEKHTNGDSVVTECGHTFGSQCWETWMSNPTGNHTCPTCRHDKPKTTFFAMRAERAPRDNANANGAIMI
jgi:hypothetical protein